jgi:hypothetical protein
VVRCSVLPAASITRSHSMGTPMALPTEAFTAASPWTKRGCWAVHMSPVALCVGARADVAEASGGAEVAPAAAPSTWHHKGCGERE